MSSSFPPDSEVQKAADAITEFALVSLEPEYLRWDKTVNMAIVEMVWNLGPICAPNELGDQRDPLLDELIQRLHTMQKARWPKPGFMVFELDVTIEEDDMLFRFSLSWDGECFRPCEIAVDGFLTNPIDLN